MSITHIPFYPSDWLAGTRGLSDAETGVYITLVSKMYEMAGPIERDDNRLYRICGCKSKSAFCKSLDYLISEGKIIEVEYGLFSEKVQKVIKEVTKKSSKARQAAQSRWDRKYNKINGSVNANASPKHMPQPCQPKPKPKPKPDKEEIGKPISCPFSEFWAVWPVRKSKAPAEKAWGKLSQADRVDAINAVKSGWFDNWQRESPGASPIHASTFLNQKRWKDEFGQQQLFSGGKNENTTFKENGRAPGGDKWDEARDRALRIAGNAGTSGARGDGA